MTIKVCGMRDPENIRAVEDLGVDWIGFIFWPGSSRYVVERPSYLPVRAKRVGVFVNASITEVMQKIEEYALDIIQLHGSESPEQVAQLSALTSHPSPLTTHLSIIKAFNIATAEDLEQTKAYEGLVDYFLFDTKCKTIGGSGQQFDWSVLSSYNSSVPFLLSGGIGPTDAERIKALLTSHTSPFTSNCMGIDLNSRFEIEPGIKDVAALRRFLSLLSHNSH